MYSQLDFRAKIYQSQEDKKVSEKVQDQDCSMKLSGYLGKFNLNLSSLKMLEIYSLTKKGATFQEILFQIAKAGYDAENGQLFQQKIWEPVIKEKEFGSLPTPQSQSSNVGEFESFFNKESHKSESRNSNSKFTNSNNNGSSSSKRLRVNGEADSNTQERQDKN